MGVATTANRRSPIVVSALTNIVGIATGKTQPGGRQGRRPARMGRQRPGATRLVHAQYRTTPATITGLSGANRRRQANPRDSA